MRIRVRHLVSILRLLTARTNCILSWGCIHWEAVTHHYIGRLITAEFQLWLVLTCWDHLYVTTPSLCSRKREVPTGVHLTEGSLWPCKNRIKVSFCFYIHVCVCLDTSHLSSSLALHYGFSATTPTSDFTHRLEASDVCPEKRRWGAERVQL